MSELDVIKRTKQPNTVNSMVREFQHLGLEIGDTILVHSSLSSIGWVCGEERTVIEALLETIGDEGTLCMPAHSGGNSDPSQWAHPPVPSDWNDIIYDNMPAYNPEITPCRRIGRIAEAFRTYPGTIRSNHPQTSFCAYGKLAQEITNNHILTPQFGKESPLGKLYQRKAKVLLLGVGYNSCTSFHMGEVLCGNTALVRMGAAIRINQVREWKWFMDYDYDNDDFEALGKAFEEQRDIRRENIGNAECRIFGIIDAVDFASDWLKVNR